MSTFWSGPLQGPPLLLSEWCVRFGAGMLVRCCLRVLVSECCLRFAARCWLLLSGMQGWSCRVPLQGAAWGCCGVCALERACSAAVKGVCALERAAAGSRWRVLLSQCCVRFGAGMLGCCWRVCLSEWCVCALERAYWNAAAGCWSVALWSGSAGAAWCRCTLRVLLSKPLERACWCAAGCCLRVVCALECCRLLEGAAFREACALWSGHANLRCCCRGCPCRVPPQGRLKMLLLAACAFELACWCRCRVSHAGCRLQGAAWRVSMLLFRLACALPLHCMVLLQGAAGWLAGASAGCCCRVLLLLLEWRRPAAGCRWGVRFGAGMLVPC